MTGSFLSFPFPMNPFSALGKEARCCSGPDLITFKGQWEGRSPAFPAPWALLCCVVKQPVPWSRRVSSGFGVYKGDACSCQRADIHGHALRRTLSVTEGTSAGNFLGPTFPPEILFDDTGKDSFPRNVPRLQEGSQPGLTLLPPSP